MRPLGVAFALLACLALAACNHPQVGLKPGAIQGWWENRLDDESSPRYLQARWGIVLSGEVNITILPGGESFDARFAAGSEKGKTSGSGATVHVGGGYWLTAAHCVPSDVVRIVRLAPLEPAVLPGRVVWRSTGQGRESDLALLRIDASGLREPVPSIRLSPEPPGSGRVLCLGTGFESYGWCGGVITAVEASNDLDIQVIRHDAPLGPGDSGGPAMLANGELAGVNILALERIYGEPESWALWIRPSKLRRIIEQVEVSRP